jgi:hypothetical protein
VAALNLGDLPRARGLFGQARGSLAADPSVEAFLAACIAAAGHDDAQARRLLGDALRLDSNLLEQARGNPFLGRLVAGSTVDAGYA